MAQKKSARKIHCDRCNTHLADPSRRVFSKFTKAHYCIDLTGCARRAARNARQRVKAEREIAVV